jgi:putative ABC transport system substrate-binding protein
MGKVARRHFVTAAIALLAAPALCQAQSVAKLPRVGVLVPGAATSPAVCPEGFLDGMRDLGYVEGRTIVFDFRYADGQPARLQNLALELVRLKPDVIWTHGRDVHPVKQATATIPIVFGVGVSVVETGLVASLAKPGGNVTGMELRSSELMVKRLELLKAVVPKAIRVAVLMVDPAEVDLEREAGPLSRALGVRLQGVVAGAPDEFETAFAAMKQAGAEALLVSENATFARNRERLLSLALKHRLPTMAGGRHLAEAGSLLSYGADVRETCRRSAVVVDKILKGTSPAAIPVERVDKFQFVVNLKTAKKLKIVVPQSVLLRADEVIE